MVGSRDQVRVGVYYQMQTVLRDVNRLACELTGEGAELPPVPLAEIEVAHLRELATSTLDGLDRIRARLDITYRTEPGEIDRRRGPRTCSARPCRSTDSGN